MWGRNFKGRVEAPAQTAKNWTAIATTKKEEATLFLEIKGGKTSTARIDDRREKKGGGVSLRRSPYGNRTP